MSASTTAASAATQKMNVAAHAVAAAMAALIFNAATLTAAYIEKLRNPSCSNVGTTAQPVTPPKSNSHAILKAWLVLEIHIQGYCTVKPND